MKRKGLKLSKKFIEKKIAVPAETECPKCGFHAAMDLSFCPSCLHGYAAAIADAALARESDEEE